LTLSDFLRLSFMASLILRLASPKPSAESRVVNPLIGKPLDPKPPPELLDRLRERDGGRVEKMPTLPMLLKESFLGNKRLDCVVLRRDSAGGVSKSTPVLDRSLSRRGRVSAGDD
jgi:hypothetical protein